MIPLGSIIFEPKYDMVDPFQNSDKVKELEKEVAIKNTKISELTADVAGKGKKIQKLKHSLVDHQDKITDLLALGAKNKQLVLQLQS